MKYFKLFCEQQEKGSIKIEFYKCFTSIIIILPQFFSFFFLQTTSQAKI